MKFRYYLFSKSLFFPVIRRYRNQGAPAAGSGRFTGTLRRRIFEKFFAFESRRACGSFPVPGLTTFDTPGVKSV